MSLIQKVMRVDTWMNAFTGLGSALRDKLQATAFQAEAKIPDDTLENLYHQEDMAARICEAKPEEALRQGVDVLLDGVRSQDLEDEFVRLGVLSKIEEAAVWGNLFGGAALYLGIDDGRNEDQPVNMKGIRDILFITVLDKRDLLPETFFGNPLEDRFGQPKTFRINSIAVPLGNGDPYVDTLNRQIHADRVIWFGGARTSLRQRTRNGGYDDSVLQKVMQVLIQFNVGWQSTSHLLQDASQGVFKLQGLVDMIAGGDKEVLARRMELVEMGRSVARSIMLDAENEDFRREQYNFQGVPDVLNAFMLRLAAAANMPVTVLMGQSPSGLNATGESDTRMWYDNVKKYQRRVLLPAVRRVMELILASKAFPGSVPKAWSVDFPSLWQTSDKERAETRKTVAETDAIYLAHGVVLAEEVATSRFGSGVYSMETAIDEETRRDISEAERLAVARTLVEEGPNDPIASGGNPNDPQTA